MLTAVDVNTISARSWIPARKARQVCSYSRWFNRRKILEVDNSFFLRPLLGILCDNIGRHERQEQVEREKRNGSASSYIDLVRRWKKWLNSKVNSREEERRNWKRERERQTEGKLAVLFYVSLASYASTKDSLFEWVIWKLMIDLRCVEVLTGDGETKAQWWRWGKGNDVGREYQSSPPMIGTWRGQSIDCAQMAQLIVAVSCMHMLNTANFRTWDFSGSAVYSGKSCHVWNVNLSVREEKRDLSTMSFRFNVLLAHLTCVMQSLIGTKYSLWHLILTCSGSWIVLVLALPLQRSALEKEK